MSNYPAGAKDDPRAPWNEKEIETETISVSMVLTISKEVEIEVPVERSNEDIKEALYNQVPIPEGIDHPIYKKLKEIVGSEDIGWNIDDMDWEEM